jgi:transaldolase
MIGRFEDAKIFAEQASEKGIELTEKMKRWAGIAITKKACRILAERNYPSKMLVASSRVSPKINGTQYIWHIEKLAGCNLVFTMNPELIKSFMLLYMDRPLENKSREPVPDDVLEKLLKIPYFAEGYGEDTIKPEDFEKIEPTVTTYNQFSKAVIDLENYVQSLF